MVESKSDHELIAQVKAGDKHAFDLLVQKYQYRLFKLVARYVSDHSEVLDVTQEAFIKAYRAIDKFRGESSFYTWLYRIAINTAKNHVISKSRKVPESDMEFSEVEEFISKNTASEHATPEKFLLSDEVEQVLFKIIDELPSDLRTAIMLREMEGLSYEEISQIMNCPVGTVRSRIFRARDAIEKRLASYANRE